MKTNCNFSLSYTKRSQTVWNMSILFIQANWLLISKRLIAISLIHFLRFACILIIRNAELKIGNKLFQANRQGVPTTVIVLHWPIIKIVQKNLLFLMEHKNCYAHVFVYTVYLHGNWGSVTYIKISSPLGYFIVWTNYRGNKNSMTIGKNNILFLSNSDVIILK